GNDRLDNWMGLLGRCLIKRNFIEKWYDITRDGLGKNVHQFLSCPSKRTVTSSKTSQSFLPGLLWIIMDYYGLTPSNLGLL
ncbi:MAG: hypothetical protein J7524_20685, partial [Roseofilum sp. Belize BBD 4]|uniref:hypothetical protein n=1 Tax=Roseofilum sp. Belize BBD 4 TaxID=2821500 RepID=UPI001B076583